VTMISMKDCMARGKIKDLKGWREAACYPQFIEKNIKPHKNLIPKAIWRSICAKVTTHELWGARTWLATGTRNPPEYFDILVRHSLKQWRRSMGLVDSYFHGGDIEQYVDDPETYDEGPPQFGDSGKTVEVWVFNPAGIFEETSEVHDRHCYRARVGPLKSCSDYGSPDMGLDKYQEFITIDYCSIYHIHRRIGHILPHDRFVRELRGLRGGRREESVALEDPILLKSTNIRAFLTTLAGSDPPVIYAILSRETISEFWARADVFDDAGRPDSPLPANHKFLWPPAPLMLRYRD